MVPVAPSRMVWRVLRCPNMLSVIRKHWIMTVNDFCSYQVCVWAHCPLAHFLLQQWPEPLHTLQAKRRKSNGHCSWLVIYYLSHAGHCWGCNVCLPHVCVRRYGDKHACALLYICASSCSPLTCCPASLDLCTCALSHSHSTPHCAPPQRI